MPKPTAGKGSVIDSDPEISLRDVWNFALRNRVLILPFVVAALIGSAVVTWRATPIYEAAMTLRLEDQGSVTPINAVLDRALTGLSLPIETEMGVLQSNTLAEEVVQSLNLMLQIRSPRGVPRDILVETIHVEPWATPDVYQLRRVAEGRFVMQATDGSVDTVAIGDPIVAKGATFRLRRSADQYPEIEISILSFAGATGVLSGGITITRPDRSAAILRVAYQSPDTILAKQIANLLADDYIRYGLQSQRASASNTVAFLRSQLDSLSLELNRAEDELQAYREGQQVVSLQAEASAQVTQLAQLQANRNGLDAERGALQQLVDEIQRDAARDPVRRGEPSPFRRLLAFPSLLQNGAASQLLQSLNTLENQRSDLLRRRTVEDPDVEALTSRVEELETQLRTIATTYLQGLGNQVSSLDQTLARFGNELSRIPAKELAVARLERQGSVLREIYMLLQTRLKEAEIAQAAEDPSVRVLDAARVSGPVSPNGPVTLLISGIFGLILGLGTAGVKDFLDRTVHTREDVAKATGGMPILGVIPAMTGGDGKANGRPASRDSGKPSHRLVALHSPSAPTTEAYRSLRTNLRFSRLGQAPKTIVVTSAMPQDGKSTTAANLAIALAQQGTRTLLVDGDLRRGILGGLFGVSAKPGLSNVLVDECTTHDTIRRIEVGKDVTLDLLPAGVFPPNPAELIGSDRMEALLRKLEEHYQAVIIDTAPLNLVTDASVVGVRAEGVILVVRAAVTERGAVRYAIDQLRGVGAHVLGAILNGVVHSRDARYGTGYGAYYADYRGYYKYGYKAREEGAGV